MNCTQIKNENGYPALYVDGKRTLPLIYALSDVPLGEPDRSCAKRNIPLFHEAGIDLVSVCTQIDLDWKEDGTYTAEHQIKCIQEIIASNPQAKILFRLNLTPPYWWMRKYPEELIKYYGVESDDTGRGPYVIFKDKGKEIKVSFVSERWYDDVKNVLTQLCDILHAKNLAKHVFAVQVAYGTYGEWHIFGKYYGENAFQGDYSAPMLAFFRAYLKEKYQTDEALQRAWKEKDITLDSAQLPVPTERQTYDNDNGLLYRLPEKHQKALDALTCLQLGAPHAISVFARHIKSIWKNVLVGSFYGYFFGCGDVFGRMLEPQMLLQDKNIDFLAGPSAYTANKRAGNATFLRYMAETMRLNGKLFICEMDQGFTSWSSYRKDPGNTYSCKDNAEYNAVMARNIFENLLRGMGCWYFDHRLPTDDMNEKIGYWDHPERIGAIADVRAACEKIRALRENYQSTADVLIVYDTQSVYHFGHSLTGDLSDVHNTYNQFDMSDAIAKSGVGYDMIFLSDLQKCDISQYKCVLFVACEVMSASDYNYVRNVVMGGGRTVAFMRRNGWIVDGKTSDQNVAALYGFAPQEPYEERQNANCRVVHIAQFAYERQFYTQLFESAGAHVYTKGGEVLCAANGFVAIHAKGKQTADVRLACGEIQVELGECSTVVFDLHTGEKIYKERGK